MAKNETAPAPEAEAPVEKVKLTKEGDLLWAPDRSFYVEVESKRLFKLLANGAYGHDGDFYK